MKNQTSFKGKQSKKTAQQSAILKAHNELKNGVKLTKKSGLYSDTPLFNKDAQTSLF